MNCVIYTYGGHQRGMGHIYQSLAMADELERRGDAVKFVVPDVPEGVAKLREWGKEVYEIGHQLPDEEKVSRLGQLMAEWNIDIAIVDILESTPTLMRFMADRADLLVGLDDIGPGRTCADLLINVIHHPPRPNGARYCEINDLNYVVLRPEFQLAHQKETKVTERVGKLLISQGGSDTLGGLVPLAEALSTLPADVEIHLLLGPAFRHVDPLAEVAKSSDRPFVFQRDVRDMAGLLQQMDLAITAGGKTLFELAALGVPFIVSIEEARELETADIVARNVLCENMGMRREVGEEQIAETVRRLLPDRERRLAMSRSGKEAVDGRGAWRSVEAMVSAWSQRRESAGEIAI